MSCANCSCGDSTRMCGGCGEPITGVQGFVGCKDGDKRLYLHAACSPPDAA